MSATGGEQAPFESEIFACRRSLSSFDLGVAERGLNTSFTRVVTLALAAIPPLCRFAALFRSLAFETRLAFAFYSVDDERLSPQSLSAVQPGYGIVGGRPVPLNHNLLNLKNESCVMAQILKARFRREVDPRDLALYTPADAAQYLDIHPRTLGTWIHGRSYPTVGGERFFKPVIEIADQENGLLSFFNLAELHVLAATRYQHKVGFPAVRAAVETIRLKFPHERHPLISQEFKTNGIDIFVQTVQENENLSTPSQLNFKNIMDDFLHNVIPDDDDLIKKIFPLIPGQPDDHVISITYGISSSQPILDGYGVPVWLIYDRHKAGESNEDLSEDFNILESRIQRAIDYIERRAA